VLGPQDDEGIGHVVGDGAAHMAQDQPAPEFRFPVPLLVLVPLLQQLPRHRYQLFALFGQGDRPPGPVDQEGADLFFQVLHVLTHGSLRKMNGGGCSGQAAQFRHVHQGLELIHVHGGILLGPAKSTAGPLAEEAALIL